MLFLITNNFFYADVTNKIHDLKHRLIQPAHSLFHHMYGIMRGELNLN